MNTCVCLSLCLFKSIAFEGLVKSYKKWEQNGGDYNLLSKSSSQFSNIFIVWFFFLKADKFLIWSLFSRKTNWKLKSISIPRENRLTELGNHDLPAVRVSRGYGPWRHGCVCRRLTKIDSFTSRVMQNCFRLGQTSERMKRKMERDWIDRDNCLANGCLVEFEGKTWIWVHCESENYSSVKDFCWIRWTRNLNKPINILKFTKLLSIQQDQCLDSNLHLQWNSGWDLEYSRLGWTRNPIKLTSLQKFPRTGTKPKEKAHFLPRICAPAVSYSCCSPGRCTSLLSAVKIRNLCFSFQNVFSKLLCLLSKLFFKKSKHEKVKGEQRKPRIRHSGLGNRAPHSPLCAFCVNVEVFQFFKKC